MEPGYLGRIFMQIPTCREKYRCYERQLVISCKEKARKNFLKTCLDEKVFPKSILGKQLSLRREVPFMKVEELLLQEHLSFAKRDVENTYKVLRSCFRDLKECVDTIIFRNLLRCAQSYCMHVTRFDENKYKNKIARLLEESGWYKSSNPDKNVVNLSNYNLEKNEKIILGYGLSFAYEENSKFDIKHIVNAINCNKGVDGDFEFMSGCVAGCLLNNSCSFKYIPKSLVNAIKNLKSNKDIKIMRSDKTNQFVIMNTNEYELKLDELLQDVDTYESLISDPLVNKTKSFNLTLNKILSAKADQNLRNNFKVINPNLPYMYGIPKTHKYGCPLRPIISAIGSHTYRLSKWLANHLSHVVGKISNAHLNNSVDFCDRIRPLNFSHGKMLSLDVVSLFTKVPVEDVIKILTEKLPNMNLNIPISISKFIKLIKLCISDNVFSVNGKYYRQKYGMSMGNPLSPILCNIFMEYFESTLLPTIINEPIPWLRYVDDIFCIWPNNQNFDEFLTKLNNLHPTITFTAEFENRGSLPYLDVILIRNLDNIKTTIYRKPTASDGYIHYYSMHEDKVKKGTISGLILRAYRICDPYLLVDELNRITCIFLDLKYPLHVIEEAHIKARKTFYCGSKPKKDFTECIILPYCSALEKLKGWFNTLDCNVAFKYVHSMKNTLIHTRSRNQIERGVYEIPCKGCNDKYFGETGRSFKLRVNEHKGDVRRLNEKSSVFNHIANTSHAIDYDSTKLVYKTGCHVERKVVESVMIDKYSNFNLDPGKYKLNPLLREAVFRNIAFSLI